jgi:hypothetical protein
VLLASNVTIWFNNDQCVSIPSHRAAREGGRAETCWINALRGGMISNLNDPEIVSSWRGWAMILCCSIEETKQEFNQSSSMHVAFVVWKKNRMAAPVNK